MVSQNGQTAAEIDRLSIFELSGKLFGIDILQSREVIPLPRFTPLPNSNDIYLGVFNLRGEIFPLSDISPLLGMKPKKIRPEDMVILLESKDFVFGVLVDKIHKVLNYSLAEVKLPRGYVSRAIEQLYTGVLEHKEGIIYILNIERLLQTQKMLAHY